jgi:hypothetical protein
MNIATDHLSSSAATATAFCSRYATLTLDYARWFLLLALLIGLAGAVIGFINSLRTPTPPVPGVNEAGGGPLTNTIDAIRNMVEAFSKAPVWVAMLGGGILLLWLAGSAGGCSGGFEQQGNQQVETSHRTSSNAVGNGAAPPTSNEAGGGAR